MTPIEITSAVVGTETFNLAPWATDHDRRAAVSLLLAAHATRHFSVGCAVADTFGPARGAESVYYVFDTASMCAQPPHTVPVAAAKSLRTILDEAFGRPTSVSKVMALIDHLSPYRARRVIAALGYDPELPYIEPWQRKMIRALACSDRSGDRAAAG